MLPNPRSQTDESLIGQLTYHRLATARSGQSHGRGTLHGFCRGSGWIAAALFVLLLSGCGDGADDDATDAERGLSDEELAVEGPGSLMPDGVTRELSWDNLIPADWQPEKLMDEYDADNLDDDDPRAQELMDKLKALWSEAPVVEDLNGAQVRLPGFVVPLESDATQISEFLLVPYFGACIHVPPPPANQTVLVTTGSEQPYEGDLFDTVWVKGQMVVEPFSDELGDAGYRIEEASVSLYEEP
jgi:hypothetical protein